MCLPAFLHFDAAVDNRLENVIATGGCSVLHFATLMMQIHLMAGQKIAVKVLMSLSN